MVDWGLSWYIWLAELRKVASKRIKLHPSFCFWPVSSATLHCLLWAHSGCLSWHHSIFSKCQIWLRQFLMTTANSPAIWYLVFFDETSAIHSFFVLLTSSSFICFLLPYLLSWILLPFSLPFISSYDRVFVFFFNPPIIPSWTSFFTSYLKSRPPSIISFFCFVPPLFFCQCFHFHSLTGEIKIFLPVQFS